MTSNLADQLRNLPDGIGVPTPLVEWAERIQKSKENVERACAGLRSQLAVVNDSRRELLNDCIALRRDQYEMSWRRMQSFREQEDMILELRAQITKLEEGSK